MFGAHDLLAALEGCGWRDEMPVAQWRGLRDRVLVARDLGEACAALSGLRFDTEALSAFGDTIGPQVDSYTKILRAYAAGSWGQFRPEKIEEIFEASHGVVRLAFMHRGRRYERVLARRGELFQAEVHRLVNQVLADGGVRQRFIALPCAEGEMRAVFISPAAMQRAMDAGFFMEGSGSLGASASAQQTRA